MSNLNKSFQAKLDKEFPPKQYACACRGRCERFGGAEQCDCAYCGTRYIDLERSENDLAHAQRNG